MRRAYEYAAMTKDECNTADGCFSTASSLETGFDRFLLNNYVIILDKGAFFKYLACSAF
jgi:hypothetical protein